MKFFAIQAYWQLEVMLITNLELMCDCLLIILDDTTSLELIQVVPPGMLTVCTI